MSTETGQRGKGIYIFPGDPTGAPISVIDPPMGSIILDATGGNPSVKNSPVGDNSAFGRLLDVDNLAEEISEAGASTLVSIRNALGVGYEGLKAFQAKIQRIVTDEEETTARILIIGDSISGDITLPLINPLMSAYGNGGMTLNSNQVGKLLTLAGGAAASAGGDYTRWITGVWVDLPTGGSIKIGFQDVAQFRPAPEIVAVRVDYLTFAGGGVMQAQVSGDGSTWEDIGDPIDTDASAGFASVTIDTGDAPTDFLRVVGISGNCDVIGVSEVGIRGAYFDATLGVGGAIMANYVSTSAPIWAAFLAAAAPDLIIVRYLDDADASYTPSLVTMHARLIAACPNADIVYVGATEGDNEGVPANQTSAAQRALMAAFVETVKDTGNVIYWDSSKVWGSWESGQALGLYENNPHPNDRGRFLLAVSFASEFELLAGVLGSPPMPLGTDAIRRAGGFLTTGGTISGDVVFSDESEATGPSVGLAAAAVKLLGGLYVGKTIRADLGIGIGGDRNANSCITITKESTTSFTGAGAVITISNPSSGGTTGVALSGRVVIAPTGTADNSSFGNSANFLEATISGAGTGTINGVQVQQMTFRHAGDQNVSQGGGSTVSIQSDGSGNAGAIWGHRIDFSKSGAGSVTTGYGYYIGSGLTTFAGTVWAIYNASTAPCFTLGDFRFGSAGIGPIIKSPDGTSYRIVVADGGGLSTVPA